MLVTLYKMKVCGCLGLDSLCSDPVLINVLKTILLTLQFCMTSTINLSYMLALIFQGSFMFSLIWSIGASVDSDSRLKFSDFLREILSGHSEQHPLPDTVGKIEVPLPPEGLCFDFLFEVGRSMVSSTPFPIICCATLSTLMILSLGGQITENKILGS